MSYRIPSQRTMDGVLESVPACLHGLLIIFQYGIAFVILIHVSRFYDIVRI